MKNQKSIDITLPDRPGVLGELCSRLWDNGVSIRACAIQIAEGCLLIRLSVDKPILARDLTIDFGSISDNQAKDSLNPETLGPPDTTSTHQQAEENSKAVVCS